MMASSVMGDPAAEPVRVAVSIPPQAFIVERIGGDLVDVMTLVEPGQSPATYEITPKQMAMLSGEDVYFKIGVPFEKNLADKLRNSLPSLPVVDCAQDSMSEKAAENNHDHHLEDPHIWLDPVAIPKIGKIIRDHLIQLRPSQKDLFESNYRALERQSRTITEDISGMLGPYRGKTFYVFHPAFGAFTKRFGLRQMAIEQEGKDPGGKYLAELISRMKKEKVRFIFVQPQFSKKSARAIADEVGAELVELDPLAFDLLANIKTIADRLVAGFAERR